MKAITITRNFLHRGFPEETFLANPPIHLEPAERVFLIRLLQASGPSPEQQTILEKLKP